jgi:uncharacterized protein involved in exopolysaccharide biosynthesis
VELDDPKLAANVANACAEELDGVNQEKSVSRAKNSRIYIESQLAVTEKNLAEKTKLLVEFQQKNRAVSLENQMLASIRQVAELKGQIIAKEVQIGVMKQSMKATNPLVIRAQNELNELNRRYNELQYGADAEEKKDQEFYLPFADVPELGLQLAELTRDVSVQETVWELLNQQYYQAKIEEARDTPTVQALDRAIPPERRSFPKRKLMVVVAGLVSFVLSVIFAFIQEYASSVKERPEEKEQWDEIVESLKVDVSQFKEFVARNKRKNFGNKE